MIRTCLLSACILLFGSGCAFTTTSIPITMRPNIEKPLTSVSENTVKVAPVQDTRTVTDKKVAFQKVNGYGAKTSGAYVADRPIADIFHDALIPRCKAIVSR